MKVIGLITDFIADIFRYIFNLTGSFGWSIIIFSVLIKLVLYPLTAKQNKFAEEIKKIEPKRQEIEKKYADRPEEKQRKLLELYSEHKINPFIGCLPMLLQLPILYGIFAILRDPKKYLGLKAAIFYGVNLMNNDYGGLKILLPVLSAATTYWQQKIIMPEEGSKQNTFLLIFFPVFIGIFTLKLPAGLGLYWVISNLLTIGQTYLTKKRTKA
ncbi:MAG: YidC/Oxa1 family membrane protein insertase [Bacillota bacterium]